MSKLPAFPVILKTLRESPHCMRIIVEVKETLLSGDKPLGIDVLPVSATSLGGLGQNDAVPLTIAVPHRQAEGYVVRVRHAAHYIAVYSTLRFDTAYAAAIHLSIETGLYYEGVFEDVGI